MTVGALHFEQRPAQNSSPNLSAFGSEQSLSLYATSTHSTACDLALSDSTGETTQIRHVYRWANRGKQRPNYIPGMICQFNREAKPAFNLRLPALSSRLPTVSRSVVVYLLYLIERNSKARVNCFFDGETEAKINLKSKSHFRFFMPQFVACFDFVFAVTNHKKLDSFTYHFGDVVFCFSVFQKM